MNVLDPKYQCIGCFSVFDFEGEARECCLGTTPFTVFLCPVCGEIYDEEERALTCCGYDLDHPPRPSAVDLEALGQPRLVP